MNQKIFILFLCCIYVLVLSGQNSSCERLIRIFKKDTDMYAMWAKNQEKYHFIIPIILN